MAFLNALLNHPTASIGIVVVGIIFVSVISHQLIKHGLLSFIRTLLNHQSPDLLSRLQSYRILRLVGYIIPILVTYVAVQIIPEYMLKAHHAQLILRILTLLFIVLTFQLIHNIVSLGLNIFENKYPATQTIIRSVGQVIKIFLAVGAMVILCSVLLNKSPILIFSSLGALTAVILLIFKDNILGFAASIQVTLLGNVSVGDWIEMPQYHADGTVIDINISNIRVQNWDKTITTIPTYALVSEPVKNWEGMSKSHTRRIKRAIFIDAKSVSFLSESDIQLFSNVHLLSAYFQRILPEISNYNDHQKNHSSPLNTRQLTNIGLFQQYLRDYLQNHPKIDPKSTLLVRQRQHEPTGIPIEIYCFTNTSNWAEYESIQADIFDHLYAILPLFKLRIFQHFTSITP